MKELKKSFRLRRIFQHRAFWSNVLRCVILNQKWKIEVKLRGHIENKNTVQNQINVHNYCFTNPVLTETKWLNESIDREWAKANKQQQQKWISRTDLDRIQFYAIEWPKQLKPMNQIKVNNKKILKSHTNKRSNSPESEHKSTK